MHFNINGNDMLACSKKCKKVAKFSYMLKKNNENEILKTFESMLRKKMQKNLEQASLQGRGAVSKSMIGMFNQNKPGVKVPQNIMSITGDPNKSHFYALKSKTTRLK